MKEPRTVKRRDIFVGVDLGQSQDFTALAIVERVEYEGERDPATYEFEKTTELRLRHLERVPLGTTYPDVVERVATVMESPLLKDGTRHLVVDATGVGRPVVDLLREAELGCEILAVTITGGSAEGVRGDQHRVPKRDLMVGLQVLLQNRALQIASGLKEGPVLVREMAEMQVKKSAGGREQFGAREGQHDDLVLAVALACWAPKTMWPRKTCGERRERLLF